ncbi:MAG: hypothetical protein KBG30_09280, partial [Bacteroidales bacterium]|nr:hypothetical protein [Bacteroidales bacterium]
LNKVIASPEALKAFRDGENLFVAIEFTDEFDVQFENAIKNAIRQMEKADLLTVKVVHFYSSLDDDLNEIYQRIKKIKSAKGLRDDEF